MRLRAGVLAATVIAALAPLGATASAATPHFQALSDPSVSIPPSFSFRAGCTGMDGSQADLDACISVAIPDFNQARAGEGLAPLVLPNDFDTLSVPEQLLALTNIERVDRDLAPVSALSSRLDSLAAAGAAAGTDPAFPSPLDGTSAGSNWFGGTSSLLAMFEWMYDDGPGSGNLDCTASTLPGCWEHRHTILGTGQQGAAAVGYDNPIAMGAAAGNGSVTVELVGGDTTDKADVTPTWAQILATSTFGLDKTNGSLTAPPGGHASLPVTATSSTVNGTLDAEIVSGAGQWSVTPSSCAVTPGSSCTFTVTFSPPSTGRFPGVLSVTNGLSQDTVALAGIGGNGGTAGTPTPRVVMNQPRATVRRGHTLVIGGSVRDAATGAALAGVSVSLQSRSNGTSPWRTLAAATTGRAGNVTFRIHPAHNAAYRLAVFGNTGRPEAVSAVNGVRVAG
ncbi:MAG TPA: hypothetical protein VHB69_14550 [Mycobacteriales bacterium]|nr:hypothetical protein [Mycobacteriales bacterium]